MGRSDGTGAGEPGAGAVAGGVEAGDPDTGTSGVTAAADGLGVGDVVAGAEAWRAGAAQAEASATPSTISWTPVRRGPCDGRLMTVSPILSHRAAVAVATAALLLGACGPARSVVGSAPAAGATGTAASPTPRPSPSANPAPPAAPTPSPAPSPAPPPRTSAAPRSTTPAGTKAPTPATPGGASAPAGAGGIAGKLVAIDPGHNGQNYDHTAEINRLVDIGNGLKACDTTGTAASDGFTEAAYNLDVAQRLAGLLTAAGARVVLTRTDNNGWGPCIDERAGIANRAHADVAISIHADGSLTGRGFHVIYPASLPGLTDAIAGPSARLAVDVRDAYAAGTGMPYSTYAGHNALDQRSDLGGLNLSVVPKVFIETGNLRSPTDAALLEDPAYRQRAAQALLAGLSAFCSGR